MVENLQSVSISLNTFFAIRKHAYSNILKILPPKSENFEIKNPDIFYTSAQNIDCGYSLEPPRRGGSNEYTKSMLSAEIRKINHVDNDPSGLRKHAYSNILKILPPKNENFQIKKKNLIFFIFLLKT